jgi:acyl carrier protein
MSNANIPSAPVVTEHEVRANVKKIILELAPQTQHPLMPHHRLSDDLEYHSLALLELAFSLEDEFDLLPIDEQTARRIHNVLDVEEHVISELRAANRLG